MKPKKLKPGWLTIIPIVHKGRTRVAKLLPLRVEPGRKFVLGEPANIRRHQAHKFVTTGFGYEGGSPVVHLRMVA